MYSLPSGRLMLISGVIAVLLGCLLFNLIKEQQTIQFQATTAAPTGETLDPACQQWVETHPPTPGSKFGLALSTSTIDVMMKVGEEKEAMTITSVTSTGFNYCGYPYPPGSPDLVWSPWSGGLHKGDSTTVTITALKAGEYTGKVTLFDLDTGLSVDIPVRVVVR